MAKGTSGATRRQSLFVGAFDALMVVVLPVLLLVGVTLLAAFIENGSATSWLGSINTAIDLWFASHGVAIVFAKQTLAGIASPAFSFALAPIGLMLMVVLFGRRTARKLRSSEALWPGWIGAMVVYGAASVVLLPLASNSAAAPDANQAVVFPAAIYGISMVAFGVLGNRPKLGAAGRLSIEQAAFDQWLANRRQRANWFWASISAPAFKAGSAVVLGLIGASALMISVSLTLNWIAVTRLYEGLQVSILGGLAITLGQLALLPNFIAYGASWLTGVGFSIGAGSSISPLGTQVGPVPSLPILGGLPIGTQIGGLAVIALPIVLSLLATVMVKNHTKEMRFNFASPISAALSLGCGIGVVAAVESAIMAFAVSGSLGPGRMAVIGINPWMLALVVFAEVAPMSVLAAFYAARPEKAAPIPDYLKR